MSGRADAPLRRSVPLSLLTLYGLGTTIGAGIYVLIGAAAGYAGDHAPLGFVLAALVIAPTAASFAELSARLPVSAGEAAYVELGFGVASLSLIVGCAVAGAGLVSSAALVQGAVGYLRTFASFDETAAALTIIGLLGAVAAWGINQSMLVAAVFTLVELAGLAFVIGAGWATAEAPWAALAASLTPPADLGTLSGLALAALVAVFAFLGFQDMVNIAEETVEPERTLPAAIALTLAVTTVLYVLVAAVAVAVVPPIELAASTAPLALVVERTGTGGARMVAVIAVGATLNGILVQTIMAARVIYGLARLGRLPGVLASIDRRTRTPLVATGVVVVLVAALAAILPLLRLAEFTSTILLGVFAVVNAALIRIKRSKPGHSGLVVPAAVPWAGLVLSLGMLAIQFARLTAQSLG